MVTITFPSCDVIVFLTFREENSIDFAYDLKYIYIYISILLIYILVAAAFRLRLRVTVRDPSKKIQT